MRWLAVFSLKRLFLIYSLPLLAAIALMAAVNTTERPDLFFLDQAFRWRGTQVTAPEVAIVAISQQDFQRGAPRWPWPRSLMARLIDQVALHQPAVIVIDVLYSERSNTDTVMTREQFDPLQPFLYQVLTGVPKEIQSRDGIELIGPGSVGFDQISVGANSARLQDQELANAVRHAASNGVSVVLAAQHILESSVAGLVEPYPELATAGGSLGLVGVRPDVDGVLRRYSPYGRDKDGDFVYGLALVAVAEFKEADLPEAPEPNGNVILNDGLLAKVVDGQFMVNFTGPPGTHSTLFARDLLRTEQDFSDELLGKIVFSGVTDSSVEDVFATPFSGTNRMARVEFHAAATDTLLQNSFITTTPRYQVVVIVIALGILAISLGRFVKPLLGFSGASGMLAAVVGAWIGAFFWHDHFFH